MSDLRWLWAEERAKCGDYRQLADLMRESAYISDRGRELIADFLDNPKKRRGAPRTFPQKWRDECIRYEYDALTDKELGRGSRLARSPAEYELSQKYGLSETTIRDIVRDERKRFRELIAKSR